MSSDQPSSAFSSLFNQLKHLRCDQNISDIVVDVRSEKHADYMVPLDGMVDVDALQGHEVEQSLTDPCHWRPLYIKSLGDGIIIVPSVLNRGHCKIWFDKLLYNYPHSTGFRSNTDLMSLSGDIRHSSLRWLTFGYHYLWDPKQYDFEHPDALPEDLKSLFCVLSRVLRVEFRPEGGIINYYTCKSRLSPHADVSEPNPSAPLFSLSLGGSAILMVGGIRKEDEPVVPILIGDGDLVIMRGERRLAFHAVPKVYCHAYHKDCSGIVRININARQVF
jgi:DNA alkylation damage repair protein AlkB